MTYLMVKDFARFQHYRDRGPVWIKLYNAVMDDEAFLALSDAARGHLILIWLLASRRDNKLPNDARAIARAIQSTGRVDLERFIADGFLLPYQSASALLAETEQDASALPPPSANGASPRVRPRARGEGEREREGEKSPASWPADGAALWTELVGATSAGRVGTALTDIVALHGWPAVRPDLQKWVAERKRSGRPCRVEYYASEASARITAPPPPPLVDEHGSLTEYGERVTRPDKVPA